MQRVFYSIFLLASFAVSSSALADAFTLKSTDIKHGEFMPKAQEFTGFGCEGGNASPQLTWTNAPKGTHAFAILVHDPDAPTGSGWWHWQIINIPATIQSLNTNAGSADKNLAPKGSRQIENDYGITGFGGACPPQGHGAHRYHFTIYALPKALDLPKNPSGALVGYMVKANALASTTLQALYKRD